MPEQRHAALVALEESVLTGRKGRRRRRYRDTFARRRLFYFSHRRGKARFLKRAADHAPEHANEQGKIPVVHLALPRGDPEYPPGAVGHKRSGYQPVEPGLPERGRCGHSAGGEVREGDRLAPTEDPLTERMTVSERFQRRLEGRCQALSSGQPQGFAVDGLEPGAFHVECAAQGIKRRRRQQTRLIAERQRLIEFLDDG